MDESAVLGIYSSVMLVHYVVAAHVYGCAGYYESSTDVDDVLEIVISGVGIHGRAEGEESPVGPSEGNVAGSEVSVECT